MKKLFILLAMLMVFTVKSKGQNYHKHKWILGYESITNDVYYDISSIHLAMVDESGIDKDTTISIVILQVQRVSQKYEDLYSKGAIKSNISIYLSDNAKKYAPWIPAKEKYKSFENIPFRYILAYGPRENPLKIFGSRIMPANEDVYNLIREKVLQDVQNLKKLPKME